MQLMSISKKKLVYSRSSFRKIKFMFIKYKQLSINYYCFFDRSSVILYNFLNSNILVYNGMGWVRILVKRWMVGKKVGSFTWNRKYYFRKGK